MQQNITFAYCFSNTWSTEWLITPKTFRIWPNNKLWCNSTFATDTCCNPSRWQADDKSKQLLNCSSLVQTQTHRHLLHSLTASSVTLSYSNSVSLHSSLLTSPILFWSLMHCFQDLVVITVQNGGGIRQPHILQQHWGLTCSMPVKWAATCISKFQCSEVR